MKLAEAVQFTQAQLKPMERQEQTALKKALKDFEAVFMGELMKDLRRTIPQDGFLGQSSQEKMMRDLLDEEWSRELAAGPGLGLAEALYRQMQRHA